jgi:hypothetical protein
MQRQQLQGLAPAPQHEPAASRSPGIEL